MMSQVQAMKKQVTQLRQEASVQRIPVSQACEERERQANRIPTFETFEWFVEDYFTSSLQRLIKHCQEHQKTDVLVTGISPSENPFKENKTCNLL